MNPEFLRLGSLIDRLTHAVTELELASEFDDDDGPLVQMHLDAESHLSDVLNRYAEMGGIV